MSEIDPKFGELIKKKRIERRLTQEEVAELIGCHPQILQKFRKRKGYAKPAYVLQDYVGTPYLR